jgi:arabinofuranosyltransferase
MLRPYQNNAAMKASLARVAIVVLFLAHALFYFIALGYDAVDDAYISFRYAQNAILGYGLVFNPGERVEGFTNFLWTALMIPVVGAGLDVGRVSIILGVLFGLGTLWLTVMLARSLQLPRWVGWLAALLLAVDGSFAIWSVSGLETALFAFLLTGGATMYILEQRATGDMPRKMHLPTSAIMFALAAMTRPEAAAVFALTAAYQIVWRLGSQLRRTVSPSSQPTNAAGTNWTLLRILPPLDIMRGVTFAALFVPYWLLRWRYYHSFFPNSFYAKVAPGGPLAQLERGWHYVTQFVDVHLGWWILLPALVALIAAGVRYFRNRADEAGESNMALFGLSYLALVIAAYGAYIVYVGGDWSVGRFFVPVLPLAYLMIAAGMGDIYHWALGRGGGTLPLQAPLRPPAGHAGVGVPNDSGLERGTRYAALVAAAALLAALLIDSSWNGEYGIYVRGFDAATATAARETMGRWLKSNVPPGTWIAVDAAGQVPYFSGLPAIDMFGINDLHIGRLSVPTLGEGTPGHEKFDLAYIIARAPRFVVIYGTLFDTVSEYRRAAVEWTNNQEFEKFLTLYERK